MDTGFIGIGSMGGMLARAWLRTGALAPERVWVANRTRQKAEALAAEFAGVHLAASRKVAEVCGIIFLCLSASDTTAVLTEMDAHLHAGQLLVTTAAVVPLQSLEQRVPCRAAKLIPSITQEIGAGISLLMYGSRVTAEDRRLLEALLERISRPLVIPESLGRPVIGLASGGPALLAYLLQSMANEAVRSNPELPPELARGVVQETAAATLRLMLEGNMTAEELIARVVGPGGMTALSIEILSRSVPQAWQAVFRETAERQTRAGESLRW